MAVSSDHVSRLASPPKSVTVRKIYAYPYEEFKADLDPRSQAMLTADYEKAVARNKVVVFVRDNETKRLASMLFDHE